MDSIVQYMEKNAPDTMYFKLLSVEFLQADSTINSHYVTHTLYSIYKGLEELKYQKAWYLSL